MLLGAKDQELEQGQYNRTYLAIALGSVLLVLALLLTWLVMYRRKQRAMETEFLRINAELKAYLFVNQLIVPTPPNALLRKVPSENPALSALSDRQCEVLTYLMAGLANREIANRLSVSENTVKYHIKNIYQVLAFKDRKALLVKFRDETTRPEKQDTNN
jgi:DNA-binding CsgD family transcriptional regulator